MISSKMGWRMMLVVASLVTLGAATGVVADRAIQMHHGAGGGSTVAQLQHDPMKVIEDNIDLRADQKAQIQAILSARQGEIDAVWEEMHERLLATITSVIDDIAAEMDADQAADFRQLIDDMHGGSLQGHLSQMGAAGHAAPGGHGAAAGLHHP